MARDISQDYKWEEVPSYMTVVEIGNLGEKESLDLSTKFEKLKFNLQDFERDVKAARKDWREKYENDNIVDQRATFQVLKSLDNPLMVENAAVFLLYCTVDGWLQERQKQLFGCLFDQAKAINNRDSNAKPTLLVYVTSTSTHDKRGKVILAMKHAGWKVESKPVESSHDCTFSVAREGPVVGNFP